mgnify:CR=1 FL=1
MESLIINNYLNQDIVLIIPKLIVALSTMAIVSIDLGLPYNKKELQLYKNPFFQLLTVSCIAYLIIENKYYTLFIVSIWTILKISDNQYSS